MTGTREFISYNIATTVVKGTGIYQHRENDRVPVYRPHIVRFYHQRDDQLSAAFLYRARGTRRYIVIGMSQLYIVANLCLVFTCELQPKPDRLVKAQRKEGPMDL